MPPRPLLGVTGGLVLPSDEAEPAETPPDRTASGSTQMPTTATASPSTQIDAGNEPPHLTPESDDESYGSGPPPLVHPNWRPEDGFESESEPEGNDDDNEAIVRDLLN